MRRFVLRHQGQILGVLSGFDRIRFRGTLRLLQSEGGVATWLERVGVAVKDFLSFAEGLTRRFCRQGDHLAEEAHAEGEVSSGSRGQRRSGSGDPPEGRRGGEWLDSGAQHAGDGDVVQHVPSPRQ